MFVSAAQSPAKETSFQQKNHASFTQSNRFSLGLTGLTFFKCLFFLCSGCGVPQLYVFVEASCVQVSVGQEHVTCLSLLADLAQQFTIPPTVDEQSAEPGFETSEVANQIEVFRSFDDIRAGSFRYVTASGKFPFVGGGGDMPLVTGLEGTLTQGGNKSHCFPVGFAVKCFVLPPNSN